MAVDKKFSSHQVPENIELDLLLVSLLVLLFSGGMIFAIMLMLMLKYLKPRLYLNDEWNQDLFLHTISMICD